MSECQKIKCKSWYDKNAIMRKFNVRYLMLVLEISKQHKMSEQWLGPGKVYKGKQTNFNLVVVVTCYWLVLTFWPFFGYIHHTIFYLSYRALIYNYGYNIPLYKLYIITHLTSHDLTVTQGHFKLGGCCDNWHSVERMKIKKKKPLLNYLLNDRGAKFQ